MKTVVLFGAVEVKMSDEDYAEYKRRLQGYVNSEVLSALAEIKIPTINDVFPEKPFDGTNIYTDMKQVVDYYESQIQSIKNRYKL